MLEFSLRLLAAGLIFLSSGWWGTPEFGGAWKLCVGIMAYAILGYAIETKGRKNAGTLGLLAIADSGAIIFLAASVHMLNQIGVLAILPLFYANRRYSANLWQMVPSAVSLLFSACPLFHVALSFGLVVQAVGMSVLGFYVQSSLSVQALSVPSLMPEIAETTGETEAFLLLRENFRKLKDRFRSVEQASKKDHAVAELHACRLPNGVRFPAKLTEKVAELVDLSSLAIYTLAQQGHTMVVRATCGQVQEMIEDASFQVDLNMAARQITDKVELSARALLDDAQRAKVATVLLQHDKHIIGMINLFHSDWDKLYEARRLCEELAPFIASLIMEERRQSNYENRIKELEILYETAVVSTGAGERQELADRLLPRMASLMDISFTGIYFIEDGECRLAAGDGPPVDCLPYMSFGAGNGLEGWLASGAPELAILDPRGDERCDDKELTRQRIGGFILAPLSYGEKPFGFLAAASRIFGALGNGELATLRAFAGEFSQAVCRIENPIAERSGLVTASAFQSRVRAAEPGFFVYLELLKRQQLQDICTAVAIEEALRSFSMRLRGKLSTSGAACQRRRGDFVAFLPGVGEEFAKSWANDVAATASMIGIKTSGGKKTVPLAFRARVAEITRQSDEVFAGQVAL